MVIEQIIEDRFKANSFILIENDECIIIDMNTNVLPYILQNHLKPKYLFLTHEHFDHIKGTKDLKKNYPDLQIISSKITSQLLVDCKGNMSFYLDGVGIEEVESDIFIEDMNEFNFHGKIIKAYNTPGHTTGSIIIYIGNVLFTGDTLLNIKTPTTLPNSSKQHLKESLEFIDNNFNDNVILYQGHGKPFPKIEWDISKSLGKKV